MQRRVLSQRRPLTAEAAQEENLTTKRLNYLQKASEKLSVNSPTISSHLQRSRWVFSERRALLTSTPSLTCQTCGQVLLIDVTSERVKQRQVKRRRPAKVSGIDKIQLRCRLCHELTSVSKPEVPKHISRPPDTTTKTSHLAGKQKLVGKSDDTKTSTNSDKTMSRKARANRASLKALISSVGSKPATSSKSVFDFSFGDFLK